MILIRKGEPPAELEKMRQRAMQEGISEKAAYARLKHPLKSQVREQMIREQGQLCAYCMCHIPRHDVQEGIAPIIMEHYIPRSPADGRSVGQGLDYRNLLAVCHGNKTKNKNGRGHKYADLTCDAHRGNIEFRKVNPCDEETLESIYYNTRGYIYAADEDVNIDLTETLNLNCRRSVLCKERDEALGELLHDMGEVAPEELLEYCEERLRIFLGELDIKTPYVGILIWYLKSMITALS